MFAYISFSALSIQVNGTKRYKMNITIIIIINNIIVINIIQSRHVRLHLFQLGPQSIRTSHVLDVVHWWHYDVTDGVRRQPGDAATLPQHAKCRVGQMVSSH